jgi:hypothetical protein
MTAHHALSNSQTRVLRHPGVDVPLTRSTP